MAHYSIGYNSYKGAVYPFDLHAAPPEFSKTCHVKSLVDLASEKIVQDSAMTQAAIEVIPKQLCEPLMKEALLKNRELATLCIIGSWPFPVLRLRDLLPQLFTSIQPLHSQICLESIVRQGLRYTTNLAHSFMEALKNCTNTKLKYLDLTGFPTAEVVVCLLATHCMLAHNEVRHATIRNMYEQAVKQSDSMDVAEEMSSIEPMHPRLPSDCSVVIKMDALIVNENTHSEVCKALKVSTFHNRKLSIMIRRLAMTCLGQPHISLLLQQVQAQYVTGLQLQYNALNAQDLVKIAPAMKTLVCLESLDLSCNTISFFQHEAACVAAAEVFRAMPRLHRLDLSNNRIKTRLRRLLEHIAQPLTYLRLAGCGLTVTDMIYLSHSIHCTQLIELDLSDNNIAVCETQLQHIISSSKSSLCVIELEECWMKDGQINSLLCCFSQLSSLMLVNFTGNDISLDCLVSLLKVLVELVSLQEVRSSFSPQCYTEEEYQLNNANFAALTATLTHCIMESNNRLSRARPLRLFLTYFDEVFETH